VKLIQDLQQRQLQQQQQLIQQRQIQANHQKNQAAQLQAFHAQQVCVAIAAFFFSLISFFPTGGSRSSIIRASITPSYRISL